VNPGALCAARYARAAAQPKPEAGAVAGGGGGGGGGAVVVVVGGGGSGAVVVVVGGTVVVGAGAMCARNTAGAAKLVALAPLAQSPSRIIEETATAVRSAMRRRCD
jgi:hypothetical protein